MRVKVLHLLTALGYGGAEVWLLNLVEPLRDLGIDVGFVLKAPERGNLRGLAKERELRTYEVRLSLSHAGYVRGIAKIARSEGYDLIHTHEFVYSAAGILAAQHARLPAAMTLHSFEFPPQTRLTRTFGVRHARRAYCRVSLAYALRRATAITAFSHAVMARAVPSYRDDPRCRLLRLCVDVHERASSAARATLRASCGWDPSTSIVIHVGRFSDEKNHAGLLRIFRSVLDARPDARLVLVGGGMLERQVLSQAGDLLDRGLVCFLGLRNDVPDLMAASDVLLFPSFNEGFGLVALEANACGIPVVGSRIPGLDEAVVDGETAILHPVDDELGMATSVASLLGDPVRALAMGDRGRQRARDSFSIRSSAELLANVYRDLLLTGGPKPPTIAF